MATLGGTRQVVSVRCADRSNPLLLFVHGGPGAIELIELLRGKYGQRKIFLLGHSWGSAIGFAIAAKRPDLLYACIGMGQIIDMQDGERAIHHPEGGCLAQMVHEIRRAGGR